MIGVITTMYQAAIFLAVILVSSFLGWIVACSTRKLYLRPTEAVLTHKGCEAGALVGLIAGSLLLDGLGIGIVCALNSYVGAGLAFRWKPRNFRPYRPSPANKPEPKATEPGEDK